MPLIGADAFSAWSQWSKLAHASISWVLMAGVLIMLVVWIKDNLPDRYDLAWLKAGGGMFDKSNKTHPPATRFNAGQKLIFWAVVVGGAALRSEEHTSELQSLMRISYAVFCLKKKKTTL